MNLFRRKNIGILFILAMLAMVSCTEDDNGNEEITVVNQQIFGLFQEVYFWYQELPQNINPEAYDEPQNFIDAIKFEERDQFSAVLTTTEFEQFIQGQSFGHGFEPGVDADVNIRVAYIFENTQAFQQGVRRSWIIEEINGTRVNTSNYMDLLGPEDEQVTNNFLFVTPDGTEREISLTKEVVDKNTVLHNEIIEYNNSKVGYIVFQEFISKAMQEIDSVFGSFVTNNVDELIVDLRYNTGGSIVVAEYIADWILGNQFSGEPLYTLKFNDKRSVQDTTANIESLANGFSLDRIVFITTGFTASASELLLNGFKPYISVTSVGSRTLGKPVGQETFGLRDYNYVILPITFKYLNANNQGEFFNGIAADVSANDDLTRNFGDPQEASLQAALNYLTTGSMAQTKKLPVPTKLINPERLTNRPFLLDR